MDLSLVNLEFELNGSPVISGVSVIASRPSDGHIGTERGGENNSAPIGCRPSQAQSRPCRL